jgi:hypothetical protein
MSTSAKKTIVRILAVTSLTALLAGFAWQVGSGPKQVTMEPTTGQQLIDLQRAKDAGAITDQEYQTQKAKFLGSKRVSPPNCEGANAGWRSSSAFGVDIIGSAWFSLDAAIKCVLTHSCNSLATNSGANCSV